ncbi:AAA family ATPase [Granulicella sp. L60]|uniref:ATP-binding protein n=1 Tax=Granulicella sp. L60 TaxID=1641866 RepID=UPI00131D3332|nr:AAA family ATPase [Granulicella sp. L60]
MYKFSIFRLDTADQSLLMRQQSSGKEVRIHLPPKAFSVLRYLVEHAGRLVAHNELMEQVWSDTFVQPEVLSSHIRDVRAALGDNARKPKFIETVSRRGYRFIATVETTAAAESRQALDSFNLRLVGRDSAFSKLHQCYRAALNGKRQLVFITGEAGIGKTALCREFLRRASNTQSPYVTWGQCIEGYGVEEPYFPVLKAIGDLCRAEGEPVVQIFKSKAPTCIVQFSDILTRDEREALDVDVRGATSGRMLREVIDALETVAESRLLILVLDDLQWVDRATVDVLSEFARRHRPAKLLIIGTFRPLDAFLNGNPITVLKEELLSHRLCSEIGLPALTQSDVDEYLSIMAPQPDVRTDLATLLYRRSEGNPLFMVAALEHSFEQGLLVSTEGRLQLSIPFDRLALDIPQSLKRILEAQLDNLGTEERRILDVASVEGVVFSPAVIALATDHTSQEVEDICHDLSTRNQILSVAQGRQLADGSILPCYQFVHVLYRDVLYERQSSGRKSARHHQIGIQLETLHRGRQEEVAAEIALHFEHASDWTRTVKFLSLAAENSERRYAHREAIALLTRALGLVDRISATERPDIELQILERLATICVASFDPRCTEIYEQLSERATAFGRVEISARALLNLATCLWSEDMKRCMKIAERASEVIATIQDPLIRAQLEITYEFLVVWADGWDSLRVNLFKRKFQELRVNINRIALAPQTIQYGIVQWASSEYREAYEFISEGLNALSEAMGDQNPYLSIDYQKAQFYLPRALFFCGEWGQALAALDTSIDTAAKNGDYTYVKMMRLNRAWIHFHAMDFEEVLATSEPMEHINHEFGGSYLVRMSHLLSGSAHTALGNYDRGLAALMKAQDEMDRRPIIFDWRFRLSLYAALAEFWLSTGDLEKARFEASRYLTHSLETKDFTLRTLALEVLARIALSAGDLSSAKDSIATAIHGIEKHDVPVSAWRVHATAARIFASTGEEDLERSHREAAVDGVFALADSIGVEHPLKAAFLSSPMVSKLLAEVHELDLEIAKT